MVIYLFPEGKMTMYNRLVLATSWFAADPMRVRVAAFSLALALSVLALVIPAVRVLADEVPGGGH
jgi:hypothetical protein